MKHIQTDRLIIVCSLCENKRPRNAKLSISFIFFLVFVWIRFTKETIFSKKYLTIESFRAVFFLCSLIWKPEKKSMKNRALLKLNK